MSKKPYYYAKFAKLGLGDRTFDTLQTRYVSDEELSTNTRSFSMDLTQTTNNDEYKPVLYTDGVEVETTNHGVCIFFCADIGNTGERMQIAALGMSYSLAKALKSLAKALKDDFEKDNYNEPDQV